MTRQRQRGNRGAGSACAMAVLEVLEQRRMLAAEVLKDINDVGVGALESNDEMVEYNGELYFFADDGVHGVELWRSDGTPDGTELVKDVNPGAQGASPRGVFPSDVLVAGGLLWFADWSSRQVWRSDGTEAGTFTVGGPQTRSSTTLGAVGDTVFFANDTGSELWKSDGTLAGTQLVKTIGAGSANPYVSRVTEIGGVGFFAAKDGSAYRLWRTDGTEGGTVVADASVSFTSSPTSLTAAGGSLFFIADLGQLWVHDPGSDVTTLVRDDPHFIDELTDAGGVVYFTASTFSGGTVLWRSDGTRTGTRVVMPTAAGEITFDDAHPTAFGGRLYFAAQDAAGTFGLWSTNPGNLSDTGLVYSFDGPTGRSIPRAIRAIGERLYILVENDVAGDALYVRDGTQGGTTLLNQMPPDALLDPGSAVDPHSLVSAGGVVYFTGQDGVSGHELWKTDGTAGGTALVRDIRGGANASSSPIALFDAGGLEYFFARHGALGNGLWRTDGTAEGTIFLARVSDVKYLGQLGGRSFFLGDDTEHGREMWVTDGTPSGTRILKDIEPGIKESHQSNVDFAAVLEGFIYFNAETSDGSQLWRSDGTEAGTMKAMDINGQLLALGSDGQRLFMRYVGKLWVSDGTETGTTLLSSGRPGSSWLDVSGITATDQGTFFAGRDSFGSLMWITDGTPEGTRPLGSGYSDPIVLGYAGGQVFFAANDGVHGQELWRTDGTDAGTYMLADANAGAGGQFFRELSLSPKQWMTYGDLLLVQLTNEKNERQLWRSDGTVDGTYMLPLPGVMKMNFLPSMTTVGGLAYVADGEFIWSTDGTVAGTKSVDWKPAGSDLRSPGELMSAGGMLLFRAHDPVIGGELWRLEVPEAVTIAGTEGDDQWTVRMLDGQVEVWNAGSDIDGMPDYAWTAADLASLRFEGLGGDDTVAIIQSGLVPVIFDGGAGSDRVAVIGMADHFSGAWEMLDIYHSTFILRADATVERVNVESGGSLVLGAGEGMTLRTRMLELGQGDVLDLNDNTLIVEGGDVAEIEALVARGRNGGLMRWGGMGIGSSVAAGSTDGLTGLGVAQVGDDVIVKYSYNGDANLDGVINFDDYFRIDQNFLLQPQNPTYAQGDFNYDGAINFDDYFLIDSAFLAQGGPPVSGDGAVNAAVEVGREERDRRRRAPVRPGRELLMERPTRRDGVRSSPRG